MSKLKLIIGGVAIAVAVLAYTNQKSTTDTLRVGTEGAYAPWNSTDADGNLNGFEVDLANKICEKLSKQCVFVKQDWDGIIPALLNNKYDIIMAGMTITDKRRETLDFSNAYADTGVVMASTKLKPMDSLASMREGLKGKTIGVQVGTVAALFAQAEYADTGIAKVRVYNTQEEMNLDLLAGRIDGGMNDSTVWTELQKNNPNVKIVSPILKGTHSKMFGEGIGAGVKKDRPELLSEINKAIAELKTDGTTGALAVKWFGLDVSY